MAIWVQLQNQDGSHCRNITQGEADRLVQTGEIKRITARRNPKRQYRKQTLPEPSESHDSPASITMSDMRCLAGLQATDEIRVERLIGYGLLPEGALAPANGYF